MGCAQGVAHSNPVPLVIFDGTGGRVYVRINGLFISPAYKWGMNWGYNSLILTFDTNFLGHPSTLFMYVWAPNGIYWGFNLGILGDYNPHGLYGICNIRPLLRSNMSCSDRSIMKLYITKHFRYLKWRYSPM